MEHARRHRRRCLYTLLLLAAILLAAGSAAAEEHHTFVLKCAGGGFSGCSTPGLKGEVTLEPEAGFTAEEDREWTLEELRQLPDFRLEGAALRFNAGSIQGYGLKYALTCGGISSDPQRVRPGR